MKVCDYTSLDHEGSSCSAEALRRGPGPLGTVWDFNERSDMKCVQGVTICCDCDLDIILEGRTKLEEG